MDDLGAELFDCLGQRPADRQDVEMVHKQCKIPNALHVLVITYLNYGIRSLERMAALYAKSRKLLNEVCFGIWGCQAKDFYLIPSTDKAPSAVAKICRSQPPRVTTDVTMRIWFRRGRYSRSRSPLQPMGDLLRREFDLA
jgi:hypothetical protein